MVLDINNIDEESVIVPALVRLYDSQKMINLAQDKHPDARNELTSIIASLLEMDLSPKESELVADVLISLMRQVERDLCLAIAERLSVMETVPLRLALHIANEEIEIAKPILKHNKIFSDMDLIYIIKSKTADYWRAIAQREEMSAEIVEMLAETGDFGTALNLVQNQSITLSDGALNALVDLAQGNDDLAGPLMRRDEATQDIIKTLYQSVSMALKYEIREEFQMFDGDIDDAIDDVTFEFVNVATGTQDLTHNKNNNDAATASHMKVAALYKEKGLLTVPLMLKTLKRGQYLSFIAQLAIYLDISRETTEQIMRQKTGQGLAVACRASDIQRSDFVSMYLLSARLRNKGGMVDAKRIKRATDYFDTIDRATARDILKSSQGSENGFLQ